MLSASLLRRRIALSINQRAHHRSVHSIQCRHLKSAISPPTSQSATRSVTVPSRGYTNRPFAQKEDDEWSKSISQRLFELTEAQRYVECIDLFERVLKHQSNITEGAAVNVLRSVAARHPAKVSDTFLDLISQCPSIRTAGMFNIMLETIAKRLPANVQTSSDLLPSDLYPASEIDALLELMQTHQIAHDYITSFHLAHISYRYGLKKKGDDYFSEFVTMHQESQRFDVTKSITATPISKQSYPELFRLLIAMEKVEFAEYLLTVIESAGTPKPWMYNSVLKLKQARKYRTEVLSTLKKQYGSDAKFPKDFRAKSSARSKKSNKTLLLDSKQQFISDDGVLKYQLRVPQVLSLDRLLLDEPSIDKLLAGHDDEYRALNNASPVDDYHSRLLGFNQQHNLKFAISLLEYGWTSGYSFPTAFCDLMIVMLCTTPSDHGARERLEIVVRILDYTASHQQELSLIPSMLALRALAQFEMPLPVQSNAESDSTDPLSALSVAHRCELLYNNCSMMLSLNDPSLSLLWELFIRSQVKHLETSDFVLQSLDLDSENQESASALTANAYVCLIYGQVHAPRRNIRLAYHLFANLTAQFPHPPEAAFYYLSLGEVMRNNASKAKLIHLRAMQQRYLTVSEYFHEAIAYAFGPQGKLSPGNPLLEEQAQFLVGMSAILSTKPLQLSMQAVSDLVALGAERVFHGAPVVRVDHLVDHCLNCMVSQQFDLKDVCQLIIFALHSAPISYGRTERLQQLIVQSIDHLTNLNKVVHEKQLIEATALYASLESAVLILFSKDSSSQPPEPSSRVDNLANTLRTVSSEIRAQFLNRCSESLLIQILTLSSSYQMRSLPKKLIELICRPLLEKHVDHSPSLLTHLVSFYFLIRSGDISSVIDLALQSITNRRRTLSAEIGNRSIDDHVSFVMEPRALNQIQLASMECRVRLIKVMHGSLLLTTNQRVQLFGSPDAIVPNDFDSERYSSTDIAEAELPVSAALEEFLHHIVLESPRDLDIIRFFFTWSSSLQTVGWAHRMLDTVDNLPVTQQNIPLRLDLYKQLSVLMQNGRTHVIWSKLATSFLNFLPRAITITSEMKETDLQRAVVDTHLHMLCAAARNCIWTGQFTPFKQLYQVNNRVYHEEILPLRITAQIFMMRIKVALIAGSVKSFRSAIMDLAGWKAGVIETRLASVVRPSRLALPCSKHQSFPKAIDLIQYIVESGNPVSPDVSNFPWLDAVVPETPTLSKMMSKLAPNSALRHSLLCISEACSHPDMLNVGNNATLVRIIGEICRHHYYDVRKMMERADHTVDSTLLSDDSAVVLDEAVLVEALVDVIAYQALLNVQAQCIMKAANRNLILNPSLAVDRDVAYRQLRVFQAVSPKTKEVLLNIARKQLEEHTVVELGDRPKRRT